MLGTSLIVRCLALSALALQRLQNRMLTASADIRQAQLNAEAAIELGLLAMKQDDNWRTTAVERQLVHQPRHRRRHVHACSVTDPVDANLADNADDPVVMLGIGYSGEAEQRVSGTVDPTQRAARLPPLGVAAGDTISLSGSTLRGRQLWLDFGQLDLRVLVAGLRQRRGGHHQRLDLQRHDHADRLQPSGPTMPDWSTVFNYYTHQRHGDQHQQPADRNAQPGPQRRHRKSARPIGPARRPAHLPPTVQQSNLRQPLGGATACESDKPQLAWNAGAAQSIDGYRQTRAAVHDRSLGLFHWLPALPDYFRITHLHQGHGTAANNSGPQVLPTLCDRRTLDDRSPPRSPRRPGAAISEYAFVKIAGAECRTTGDFYVDDLDHPRNNHRPIHLPPGAQPGVNPFGVTTNAQGIYWINCGGNKLVIERSRIQGTLLVVNPGAGSCIGNGPINWSPAVAGYPALLVDADTADERRLRDQRHQPRAEREGKRRQLQSGRRRPRGLRPGRRHERHLPSAIRGLIAVEDDLTLSKHDRSSAARSSSATTSRTPAASSKSNISPTRCSIRRPASRRPTPTSAGRLRSAKPCCRNVVGQWSVVSCQLPIMRR